MEKIKGKSKMPEYKVWKEMKARCYAPSRNDDGNYRKNGITVCDEWLDCFEQFYEDMGEKPPKMTLDRIDNLKGYNKENCRWVDMATQSKNRGSFNIIIEYQGKVQVLKDWAKELDIPYNTLRDRLKKGLTFEQAIDSDPYKKLIEINGEKKRMKEWCEIYEIEFSVVNNRINKHKWDPAEAIITPKGQKRKKIQIKI